MTNSNRVLLYILFFISGAVGLLYETTWLHLVQTITGSALTATSIVVASFMAGLALGAVLGGILSQKTEHPVRWYGFLEILLPLALWCCFGLYRIGNTILPPVYGDQTISHFYRLLKYLYAFVITLPVPIILGATLPLIIQTLSRSLKEAGSITGKIYFANTLGAAFGTFVTGFFLIKSLGIIKTQALGTVINLLIGITALLISRYFSSPPAQADAQAAQEKPPVYPMLLLVYALIGFASMGCEIAWIRLLDTRFWSTIYSFSLVLSVFLMGIALGGFIFKKYLDNKSNPFLLNLLFILFILNSLAICASLFILIRFPLLFSLTTLKGLILSQGMVCMAAILAPTIITGLCFPLVVRIYTDKLSRIGKSAGLLYSVNTIGGVAGSLAVTFIFIPFIGTAKSLGFFAALLCIVLPVLLFFSFMGKSNIKKPLFILIIPPILMILPLSNFQLSSIAADSGEIVTFYREGPLANLAVIDYKHSPFRRLRINGIRAEGGTNPEALQSQRIQVELPAALHANPEQMLVLGLGTGISLGALKELKKVKAVDCIEISKEIVDASVFFKKENRDILNDPRVTLYLDDARHFTAATQRKYDLIIGDLFFPWLKGSGSLYTVAHFENCKKRLKPGGMVCQWLPLYQFTMENLEIILNTFASVFPSCELWFGHFSPEWPIVMMAGYLEDRKKRQPALAPDIMARYICPVVPHPDKPVTTDMSPKTEFLGADFFKQNFELKTILKYLLDSYTNNDPGIEDVRSKRQYIQSLLEIFILFIEGNIRTPVERLHDLTALDNSLPYAEFVLPQIARKVHDNNLVALVPDLVLFLEKITGRYREDFQLFGYLCKFQLMLKDHEKALGTCSVCTELNPRDENALINLGIAYALTGKDDLAVSAWQRVLSINPYNAKAMINIKRNRENRGME